MSARILVSLLTVLILSLLSTVSMGQDEETLRVGERAVVTSLGSSRQLEVYENPSFSERTINRLGDGVEVEVIGGPIPSDGLQWWQIYYRDERFSYETWNSGFVPDTLDGVRILQPLIYTDLIGIWQGQNIPPEYANQEFVAFFEDGAMVVANAQLHFGGRYQAYGGTLYVLRLYERYSADPEFRYSYSVANDRLSLTRMADSSSDLFGSATVLEYQRILQFQPGELNYCPNAVEFQSHLLPDYMFTVIPDNGLTLYEQPNQERNESTILNSYGGRGELTLRILDGPVCVFYVDNNVIWWRVEIVQTGEIGWVPENLITPLVMAPSRVTRYLRPLIATPLPDETQYVELLGRWLNNDPEEMLSLIEFQEEGRLLAGFSYNSSATSEGSYTIASGNQAHLTIQDGGNTIQVSFYYFIEADTLTLTSMNDPSLVLSFHRSEPSRG